MRDDYFNPETYMVIDRITGEEVPVDIFIKDVRGVYWEKAYASTLAEYIGVTGDANSKLLAYLIKEKTPNNLIVGTVRSISDDINVSTATVVKLFRLLRDKSFLKKVRNGVYVLSPELLRHGSNTRGALLLRLWREDEGQKSQTLKAVKL